MDDNTVESLLQKLIEQTMTMVEEVRGIRSLLQVILIPDRTRIVAEAISVIGNSQKRAEVYLATDGTSSATEIAEELGMKRPNVSIEQGILAEAHLIEPDHVSGKGFVYRKSQGMELLGFSTALSEKFGLKDEEKTD